MPPVDDARRAGASLGTLSGVAAILVWSTVVAFARSLTEELGTFTAAAAAFLVGGVLACGVTTLRVRGAWWRGRWSWRYLLACGGLFVSYEVLLYAAIGSARDGQQVLEVGLLNYLWIGFTLLFAVPLLGKRPRWPLAAGMAVGFAGVALAQVRPGYSLAALSLSLRSHGLPYALALGAAVAWGLYSNLARRWAGEARGSAAPLFILAAGLALVLIRCFVRETSAWSPRAALELAYMAVFPTTLGYVLWDVAMRRGDVVVVASLSFAIPLASTLFSARYLDVAMGPTLWIGCALVSGGAVLCRRGLAD
jgi:drug/metabolite transporter (DMT)-like permease